MGPLLIIAVALWRLVPELSHPGIHDWDEAMHLAVARGLVNTPLTPHIHPDPLHPVPVGEWVNSGVWLHKPPGSMWLSALLMAIFGVGTGVARFASVIGMTCAALALYALLKHVSNRIVATVAGMALVSLPFAWEMTQGYMFGDMTDTTLAGAVAGSVALIVYAARKGSAPLAIGAGAAMGYGYLCKSALALTPLGVAVGLAALGVFKFKHRLRPTHLLLFAAAAAAVALPWTFYASHRWPELWAHESNVTMQHLTLEGARANHAISMWVRPLDAIFNEHHGRTLAPFPRALPLVAGLWLLISAFHKREVERLAVAAWLWATWLLLSYAAAKVPATAWGAVAATFFAMAVLIFDAFEKPALAGAVAGALLSDVVKGISPKWLLNALPQKLEQTRGDSTLMDGLLLAAAGALVVGLVAWGIRKLWRDLRFPIAAGASALLIAFAFPGAFKVRDKIWEGRRGEGYTGLLKDAGLTVAAVAPKKSAVFLNIERNGPSQFDGHSALFWMGRAIVGSRDELKLAKARGYHPYILSASAEPYAIIEAPPGSWMHVYDVDRPGEPPPIPSYVSPLDVTFGKQRLKGFAVMQTPFDHDRWAFYVEPNGEAAGIDVTFELKDGKAAPVHLEPEGTQRSRASLNPAPWFILPGQGPKREDVASLSFKHTGQRVTLR